MTPTTNILVFAVSLLSLLAAPLITTEDNFSSLPSSSLLTNPWPRQGGSTDPPQTAPSPSLLLLAIHANLQPTALRGVPKVPEKLPESPGVPEPLPRPLAQIMFPKNVTSAAAGALAPPLGAAQVAPPPRRLVDVDVCQGYYDVMGQLDSTFNCSNDGFIYCCGTCHYRFCCPDRNRRLEQSSCNNYVSPDWAKPSGPNAIPLDDEEPEQDPLQPLSHNTGFVIGGVIVFMVAVAVGIKIMFNKVSRQANHGEINMPRALVDMLRHQSSPVQQDERNNSVVLCAPGEGQGTLGRPPKNLYAPCLPSKDNRLGNIQHNFIHSGTSPKHTATIERAPRMNNAQLAAGGTLLSSKHNNTKSQPSFHHSLHNLAQLPPSYENATKPELNRYSSLKRLEKGGLDEYSSGYCTTKRRPHTAQPALQSSSHHLPWGGDYTMGGRGTLPRHAPRPWIQPTGLPPISPTVNPYPLDPSEQHYNPNYETLSKPARKVMSQDQLLNMGDVPGNTGTLSRMSKNQQHQYYKAMAAATKNSNTQTLTRKPKDRPQERPQDRPQERPQDRPQDRLLMSPDHLEERMGRGVGGMGVGVSDPYAHGAGGVMAPTLPRGGLTPQQKAQSQQNVCATPSLDRHHMIKMNSHPTSGREQERSQGMTGHMSGGIGGGMGGWGGSEMPGAGVVMGTGTLGGHSAKRMAFAAKRQNTIEQLHFIPGGGSGGTGGGGGGGGSSGGGGGGGSQGIRTGSKNEVTV
ncbi:protein shisa-7 [Esox lucius]|uniref:Shisa N-terminal domain-containing protein n=1 Tax=Esox lucius TaxID=8010 RepID=A0A3P9A6A3_ESOLU|nr:protein shisa-7 [Esox lucius]XP_019897098.1 protein shisa-7 [Esox lucius]XP_019897099.1 protein shisa-7 [Esox lucius]